MSDPRLIVPGDMHFVCVRAVRRTFQFVPKRWVRDGFGYVLGLALQKHGVLLHELIVVSNHSHMLLTDPRGVLPDFMRTLNSLLARHLNAVRGERGTVIEKGFGDVTVHDDIAIDKAVYTLCNANAAGLVRRINRWPGLHTGGMRYGESMTFARPKCGLWAGATKRAQRAADKRGLKSRGRRAKALEDANDSELAASVTVTLHRPAVRLDLSDDELRSLILDRVREQEDENAAKLRDEGRSFLGAAKVKSFDHRKSPTSEDPLLTTVPHVAANDPELRRAARERLKAFYDAHAACWLRFIAGEVGVQWPAGTWLMRVRYRLNCAQDSSTGPPAAAAA